MEKKRMDEVTTITKKYPKPCPETAPLQLVTEALQMPVNTKVCVALMELGP